MAKVSQDSTTQTPFDLTEARRKHRQQGAILRELETKAGITTAEKHRQLMAEKSRANSVAIAEIGLPPPRSERLYNRYRKSLWLFLTENFPASLGLSPLSDEHKRMVDRLEQTILEGGQELIIAPRGFVKSTILELTAIWAAGFGHRKFLVLLAATDEMSSVALDSIQYEFETNERLLKIFPAACHAARALEGIPQRAPKQTIGGSLTRIEWSTNRIVLPTVKGFNGSGCIIWPRSISAKGLRGTRFKRPDGEQARPDYVLGDDLQTDESAASPSQTEKRKNILHKTVLRLGSHRSKLAICIVGTIIEQGDLVDQLSDRKKCPAWRAMKIPMMKSLSTAHEKWVTEYAAIRGNYNPEDDADRERAENEANTYYEEHQDELDAGAEATWQSCFIVGRELSATQHAYNILIDSGPEAFHAECQNSPMPDTGGLLMLSRNEMAERQSPFARRVVPPMATQLTAFVDCHHEIFYIEVWAWEPDGTGYLVDWLTFPEQTRHYFSHRQVAKPLSKLFKGLDAENTVAAGLSFLLDGDNKHPGLMAREYRTPDGTPCRVARCLVDANGEFRDRIIRVLTNSRHSANLNPSFGKGVGAKHAPVTSWAQYRKQGHGGEWVFTLGRPGEINGIMFDANFYKTKFWRALTLPRGSAGALYLPNAPEEELRLFIDHCHSELPDEVTVGPRTVYEFSQKPNTDNHMYDAAIGNLVAASRMGIGQPTRPAKKPKRKTTYYGNAA